ncbi:hypothetical protein V8C37DRAFT_45615 [Trichoderma ceciliae]
MNQPFPSQQCEYSLLRTCTEANVLPHHLPRCFPHASTRITLVLQNEYSVHVHTIATLLTASEHQVGGSSSVLADLMSEIQNQLLDTEVPTFHIPPPPFFFSSSSSFSFLSTLGRVGHCPSIALTKHRLALSSSGSIRWQFWMLPMDVANGCCEWMNPQETLLAMAQHTPSPETSLSNDVAPTVVPRSASYLTSACHRRTCSKFCPLPIAWAASRCIVVRTAPNILPTNQSNCNLHMQKSSYTHKELLLQL